MSLNLVSLSSQDLVVYYSKISRWLHLDIFPSPLQIKTRRYQRHPFTHFTRKIGDRFIKKYKFTKSTLKRDSQSTRGIYKETDISFLSLSLSLFLGRFSSRQILFMKNVRIARGKVSKALTLHLFGRASVPIEMKHSNKKGGPLLMMSSVMYHLVATE